LVIYLISPELTARTDLYFETYPISFIQQRGWSLGIGSLPFIAVMVGVIIGCLVNYIFIKTRYMRLLKQHGRVPPEERLIPMMVGSILLPIGLFWYAWTSRPGTPWPAQVCAGVPTGAGQQILFHLPEDSSLMVPCCRRYPLDLLTGHQLHHRRVQDVQQLRDRRQHHHPIAVRRRLPHVR